MNPSGSLRKCLWISFDVSIFFFMQVFQVRKVSGAASGKIFAMKVLKKVSESGLG